MRGIVAGATEADCAAAAVAKTIETPTAARVARGRPSLCLVMQVSPANMHLAFRKRRRLLAGSPLLFCCHGQVEATTSSLLI
jgi:hypothetical protein